MIKNNQSYKKLPFQDMGDKNKWKSFPCTNKNLIVKEDKKLPCPKKYYDIDERDCQNLNLDIKQDNFNEYDIHRKEFQEDYDDDDYNDDDDNDEKYLYDENTVKNKNSIDNNFWDYNENDDFEELNINIIDNQIYKKSLYS